MPGRTPTAVRHKNDKFPNEEQAGEQNMTSSMDMWEDDENKIILNKMRAKGASFSEADILELSSRLPGKTVDAVRTYCQKLKKEEGAQQTHGASQGSSIAEASLSQSRATSSIQASSSRVVRNKRDRRGSSSETGPSQEPKDAQRKKKGKKG